MDAAVATPKPPNITTVEAATVGVGFYTACLGVFGGLNIPIPKDQKNLPAATGEPVLVLGGSSSVGKFAIQLLKALGYKVLTTGSPKSSEVSDFRARVEPYKY
jgi:NADPH:quinone reductase-like Zn-dependent oxidoreductase